MALSIKNPNVEHLITEVANLAGESKTEAVRRALEERRDRLVQRLPAASRGDRLRRFLEHEVWPAIPRKILGKPLTKTEEEAILGYGEDGT